MTGFAGVRFRTAMVRAAITAVCKIVLVLGMVSPLPVIGFCSNCVITYNWLNLNGVKALKNRHFRRFGARFRGSGARFSAGFAARFSAGSN